MSLHSPQTAAAKILRQWDTFQCDERLGLNHTARSHRIVISGHSLMVQGFHLLSVVQHFRASLNSILLYERMNVTHQFLLLWAYLLYSDLKGEVYGYRLGCFYIRGAVEEDTKVLENSGKK
jgi:hypothetical protein